MSSPTAKAPTSVRLPRDRNESPSSSMVLSSSGAPFFFPELGEIVEFVRADGAPTETGIVKGREFVTLRLLILTDNGTLASVEPGQYSAVTK